MCFVVNQLTVIDVGKWTKWVYPPLFQTKVGGGKMQTSSPPVITPNRSQSNPDDMITLPQPIQSVGMDLHDVSGTSTGQTLPRERRAPPGTHFCPTIWWVYPHFATIFILHPLLSTFSSTFVRNIKQQLQGSCARVRNSRALSLRNLVSGYECGRVFPAGVGPGSPSRDAANWLPSRSDLSVETRWQYGWLRMVFSGVRLFRAPIWWPSGGWRHARGREHYCRGEPGGSLSGGYAPDSAKAEGSSIVDEPGEG